jgi:hypothetical protein
VSSAVIKGEERAGPEVGQAGMRAGAPGIPQAAGDGHSSPNLGRRLSVGLGTRRRWLWTGLEAVVHSSSPDPDV